MHPTGFNSWKDYFSFTLARRYVDTENNPYPYQFNILEKTGQIISRPLIEPLNFLTENIKNPLLILALAVTLIGITTIAFYPAQFLFLLSKTIPIVLKIEPWMIKFATYITIEITILGISLRALGRVCNKDLCENWRARNIHAIHLGDIPVQ